MGILFLLVAFMSSFHPLYLSTTQIEVHQDGSWEGTIRFFYDDLEDALQNELKHRPTLTDQRINEHLGEIDAYLRIHLTFKDSISDHMMPYHITSGERVEDVIFLRLNGDKLWSSKVLITCNLLLELFETQKNVFEIGFGDQSLYAYLKKDQRSALIVKPK